MRTSSRDGTAIAFQRRGEGAPIILVGGALSDLASADPLAALLCARFSVLTYDRRGRGESGDTPPYTVEREVEDLNAVLQAAGGSAMVFGHSSGGVLVLHAASRGLPITRLAVYEPPFIVDASRPPLPPDYAARITGLVSAGRRGEAVEYFLSAGPQAPAAAIAKMRLSPAWPRMEAMAHTVIYDSAIMGDRMEGRPLAPGAWSSVTAPALVMDGGASPAWLRHAADAVSRELAGARRMTLEGQTHSFSAAAMAPVLEEFFGGA